MTDQQILRVYSHDLLLLPSDGAPQWRFGYLAQPTAVPGRIRVSRAVAVQIARDMQALRTETRALLARSTPAYEDAIAAVDARLPRIDLDGEHLIADWRHVTGDSDAVHIADPGPDGLYTLGLDLDWHQTLAVGCGTVHDDTTSPSPIVDAYEAYVGCFTDATAALQEFAHRAGIAVAWLDRAVIEAYIRTLTDDEWERVRVQLDGYDEHVMISDEVNSAYLNRILFDAGADRYRVSDESAGSGGTRSATA